MGNKTRKILDTKINSLKNRLKTLRNNNSSSITNDKGSITDIDNKVHSETDIDSMKIHPVDHMTIGVPLNCV